MDRIIGNIVGVPNPKPDWNQTDETKADFIKNKPTKLSQFENDCGFSGSGGGGGGSIVLDDVMSDTSENAVQNKVIKAYVDEKFENHVTCGEGEPKFIFNKDIGDFYFDTNNSNNVYVCNSLASIEGGGTLLPEWIKLATEADIGNIESALDAIIEIQNELIGGDAE